MKAILSTIIPFLSLINGQSINNGRSGEPRQVIRSSPSSGCVLPYEQCGGTVEGNVPYTGETCCDDGYVCTFVSQYRSQCNPNTPDFQNNPPITNPVTPATPVTPDGGVSPEASDPITGCKLAYAQCGGLNYQGEICCEDETICTELSEHWSQCQPINQPVGEPGVAPPNPPPRLVQTYNNGQSSNGNKCLLAGELCGLSGAQCCSGLECIQIERGNSDGIVIEYQCLAIN